MTWEENYLAHHGVEGMRWHVRRFQNEDGSYTEEGRRHYGIGNGREKSVVKRSPEEVKQAYNKKNAEKRRVGSPEDEAAKAEHRRKVKKALAIAAGVGVAAIAGAFAYQVGKQWLGNLQEEMINQAKENRSAYLYTHINAADLNRKYAMDARVAKDPMRKAYAAREARNMYGISMAARKDYQKYDKIAKTATGWEALGNYLKNKRKIVI